LKASRYWCSAPHGPSPNFSLDVTDLDDDSRQELVAAKEETFGVFLGPVAAAQQAGRCEDWIWSTLPSQHGQRFTDSPN
jgi:hypothetical protein